MGMVNIIDSLLMPIKYLYALIIQEADAISQQYLD